MIQFDYVFLAYMMMGSILHGSTQVEKSTYKLCPIISHLSQVRPLPPRSSAYKTALLKDLEASSTRLAAAKESAVKRLAGGYELDAGAKVS